jgi:hypothetical protein
MLQGRKAGYRLLTGTMLSISVWWHYPCTRDTVLTGNAQRAELEDVRLEICDEALGLSVGALQAILLQSGREGKRRRLMRNLMSTEAYLE